MKKLKPRRDYCPRSYNHKHSFNDYTYWGTKHPMCDYCSYRDTTREFEIPEGYEDKMWRDNDKI